METVMIVLWVAMILATVVFKFFTKDFYSLCLSAGAAVALLLVLCHVEVAWQLAAFMLISILAVIGLVVFRVVRAKKIAAKS